MEYIPLIISSIALIISLVTFWLTRIRIGNVKMTRPNIIFFGPDGTGSEHRKVYIRTLLYSNSEKGNYVQNMYLKLLKDNKVQVFNIWIYSDKNLERGSGLYVSKNGVSANHHFLAPKDAPKFEFASGIYKLQIFLETVNGRERKIFEQSLTLREEEVAQINNGYAGVFFDWAPNLKNYISYVDTRTPDKMELSEHIKLISKEKRS